jgi:two-component system response regulator AtoC
MEMLKSHEWIGNVRELENTLMQAVVLSSDDVLTKENILLRVSEPVNKELTSFLNSSLADMEKMHIKAVLDSANWDKQKAHKILGISVPTLYSKIEKYNLEKNN